MTDSLKLFVQESNYRGSAVQRTEWLESFIQLQESNYAGCAVCSDLLKMTDSLESYIQELVYAASVVCFW